LIDAQQGARHGAGGVRFRRYRERRLAAIDAHRKRWQAAFHFMNQAGKVAMFDIAHPAEPRLLKVLDLGANCAYLRPAAVGHQRLFPE
jgi:hypothetical protein